MALNKIRLAQFQDRPAQIQNRLALHNPGILPATPRGKLATLRGKVSTPRVLPATPRGEESTPRVLLVTPRGRVPTLRGKLVTPWGRVPTPRGKATTLRGKLATPEVFQMPPCPKTLKTGRKRSKSGFLGV
jgi:hypothetical protein